ncbi:hypothetical protein ID866_9494 [Astraeus odoratus]|nr:hypothetical protein ID866_9494 [Astraeus odoratus]
MGSISVSTLLDSGATDCFVDKRWAQERHLRLLPLPKKVPVLNMDGTTNCAGEVSHGIQLLATNLGKIPMILGHAWLNTHNPEIDWVTGRVTLNHCQEEWCCYKSHPMKRNCTKKKRRKLGYRPLKHGKKG